MKKIGKFFLVVILAIVVFFFWASSSSYTNSDHTQLISYKDGLTSINHDSIFSIATYNIGYLSGMTNNLAVDRTKSLFDENLKKTKSVFKTIQPDIIAFQEIDYDSKRSFNVNQQEALSSLGFSNAAQAVNWDVTYLPFPYWPISSHFGKTYSGQSILSKFEVSMHEVTVLSEPEGIPFWRSAFYLDRLAQVVTLAINGQEIKIINVHLEAFDQDARKKQTNEVNAIYHKYAGTYPTFLVGDFNSDMGMDGASVNKLLVSSNIAYAVIDTAKKTYPSDRPAERLDYIFYNTNFIEKVDARIVTEIEEASDHLPVLMRFKLKPRP